ncbi:MAG: hypothetical protein H6981_04550 [Gammaproteobacteria bacterium]|nr:hypothetical protein [Gammaproteobacteria bacterium]
MPAPPESLRDALALLRDRLSAELMARTVCTRQSIATNDFGEACRLAQQWDRHQIRVCLLRELIQQLTGETDHD